MLYFSACWHFTVQKALSCHSNWFIWEFIAKSQRHISEREIVKAEGQLFTVRMSVIFVSIYLFSSLSNSLCIFPSFPSVCGLQHHHRPTSTLFSNQLLLRANFACFILPGSVSKLVCVMWLTLLMGLCVHLLAWKLKYCLCFAVYWKGWWGWGNNIYLFGLEFSVSESLTSCHARFPQVHKNKCIAVIQAHSNSHTHTHTERQSLYLCGALSNWVY